jgi:hypothetical protein
MYVADTPCQEPDLDRPSSFPPPRLDPVEIVCSCQPAAPVLPMQAGAGAMGRSSLCVGLSARSLDGPWSPLPRFVLGVGVGGSRDALVHGLVRAGSCVTGERRPSDLAIAGSGSVAVPAARARVHQDGGNPGPLPGATPRSLTGYRTAPGVQSRARSATSTARSRCCQRTTGTSCASASQSSCCAAELGMS